MRICLLTNQNLLADPFPADDWPCDPRPFYPDAHWDVECLEKATSVKQVTRRIREGFDLFFNLCDGAADQNTPGIEVVKTLEEHGVAFTGATTEFYEPSRQAMKVACRAEGIDTPDYVLARCEADVELAAHLLRFPMIVKHYSSYSSVDLSRRSRVCSPAGLRQQTRKIVRRHGAALIEEFIEGTECTVLVAENPDDPARPKTYTPVQYRFPEGETFKHSDMKWVDFAKMAALPVEDPVLDARLRDISARFFLALKVRASVAAISASTAAARSSCWRSIPTVASTIFPRTPAAPTFVCCTIRKGMPASPASLSGPRYIDTSSALTTMSVRCGRCRSSRRSRLRFLSEGSAPATIAPSALPPPRASP